MREFAVRRLLGPCLLALFSPVVSWCQLLYPMFQDVPFGAAYYDEVHILGERMITHGCTVVPNNYCPGWSLTRGQAAVLIVRSIFSGRSGDPDTFSYSQTPYFTDVDGGHPQFPWIQKMKELGVTSGCTATTYCPDGNLSFSQLAVFTHRGRQLRFNQALTPPPPCNSSILGDVPQNHMFCGYIQSIYYEHQLFDTARSPYCYTGFCPDNLAVDRGTSAFYLVTGILAATVPESLPNSSSQLPPVNLGTFPGLTECNHGDSQGDYYYANHIDVIGQSMRAWAETGVINPSNPVVWDNYVALDFWQSGTWPPLFTQSYSTGSALDNAHLESGNHSANSSYNYLSDSRHQVASFCITGGLTSLQTKNDPMILSTNTTVLYRGTTQAITFRGSSLAQVQGVESQPAALGGSVLSSQQFEATVNVTTPFNAAAGSINVRLSAVAPVPQVQNGFAPTNGESHKTNYLAMTVADPTPALSSLSHNSGTQGDSFQMDLNGGYFGANPRVCINGVCNNGAGSSATSNGVSLTQGTCSNCTGTNAVLSVMVVIGSNATLGSYPISVLSWGASGNGWAPAPQGQNQQGSGQLAFQVQGQPVSIRLERVGEATIDASSNYSEDTTIRVTAVNPTNGAILTTFTGTVNIAEDGTAIYSQNTQFGATLPSSVSITSGGTSTFVAKSLADPSVEGAMPPADARIKATNYPVEGGASLVVPQWIVPATKIHALAGSDVYAWVQKRMADIFANAIGDKATVLASISTYSTGALVFGGEIVGGLTTGRSVQINPYFGRSRVNMVSNRICGMARPKAFETTVLHEARHAYQYMQSQLAGNDTDGDRLVNVVQISPTTFMVDSTDPRDVCNPSSPPDGLVIYGKPYNGPTLFDAYSNNVEFAIEMDAYLYAGYTP